MAKMTGRGFLFLDGKKIRIKDAELKPGGKVRKPVMDSSGHCGNKVEEVVAAEITGKIPHGDDVDLVALQDYHDGTATFQTDSGQTYVVRDAATTEALKLGSGDVDITLSGAPAEKV